RGNDCVDHCWNVCGRDVQVPCLGLKSCPVFRIIPKIASKFTIGDRYIRYICAKCFEKHENPQFQENLFGQSAFTSEWDEKFDIIVKQLINRHNKDFGVEEINAEILTI
ncbi:8041_t:CDS:2, partial [Dentiscutata erythropus]